MIIRDVIIHSCWSEQFHEPDLLFQSLQEGRSHCSRSMMNVNLLLQDVFGEAIRASCPELDNPPLVVTPNQQAKFGDYQCNSAMAMAQVRVCCLN